MFTSESKDMLLTAWIIFKFCLYPEVQSNIGSDPEDFEGAILTEALQQSQWTAVAYCFHLISNVISLIERAIEGANRCDGAVILLNNVLNLLCLHDVKSSWTSESGEREVRQEKYNYFKFVLEHLKMTNSVSRL